MPFKLRLKKSKQQYNVASKSVYVITVELLDNAQLECTLTSESTGRDCMSNVCQVLNSQLHLQPEGVTLPLPALGTTKTSVANAQSRSAMVVPDKAS